MGKLDENYSIDEYLLDIIKDKEIKLSKLTTHKNQDLQKNQQEKSIVHLKSKSYEAKLKLRNQVVDCFNKTVEIKGLSKSIKAVVYTQIPIPTIENMDDEIKMLIEEMVENLDTLNKLSKYSE